MGSFLIVSLVGFLMIGPSVILFFKGREKSQKGKKDEAKKRYILAVAYLLISFGSCGALIMSLKI